MLVIDNAFYVKAGKYGFRLDRKVSFVYISFLLIIFSMASAFPENLHL